VILEERGEVLPEGSFFENIKKNKRKWLIYIPLTVAIDVVISLYPSCFFQILVGLMTFGIPYYFGVKSTRTLIKSGLVILLITGMIFGSLYTVFLYNQMYVFEEQTLSGTNLSEGIVSPYLGDKSDTFTYTVKYTGDEDIDNITVYVNIFDFEGGYSESFPMVYQNGTFVNQTQVGENIYYYNFTAYINSTDTWIGTNENGYGPLTMSFSQAVGVQIFIGIGYILLNGGIFFLIIIGLYYWRKSTYEQQKKLREEIETLKDEKEESKDEEDEEEEEKEKAVVPEEFECTECGAPVSEDAEKCPSCGEAFDED
jgi:hypothetical protein